MSHSGNNSFEVKPRVKNGIYRHYKGGLYEVKGVGLHSETKEQMVIYQNIEHGTVWIRPEDNFLENVIVDGVSTSRFKLIRETL